MMNTANLDAMRLAHPCNTWANAAGHADWAGAVKEMKSGKVLVGRMPLGEKSGMDLKLFMEQVRAEGLHCYVDDTGAVCLGEKGNFPQSILDSQDRELRRFGAPRN